MFGRKLTLSDALYERLRKVAEARGYSSVEEFALHVLEKTASEAEQSLTQEEVRNRLKGMGYLE